MKTLFIISLFAITTTFFACNSAHNKTGGATRDSSASHGNSGPDTANGAGVSEAMSTNGSDTSSNGQITDPPVADTAKAKSKKHH